MFASMGLFVPKQATGGGSVSMPPLQFSLVYMATFVSKMNFQALQI